MHFCIPRKVPHQVFARFMVVHALQNIYDIFMIAAKHCPLPRDDKGICLSKVSQLLMFG